MAGTDLVEAVQLKWGLNERQAELAMAYAETGLIGAACRRVKYNGSHGAQLLRENPNFIGAVREAMDQVLARDAVRARACVYKLMERADSERIRLEAAKALREWAVGQAPQKHIHEHRFAGNAAALRSRITTLVGELGLEGQVLEGEIVQEPSEPPAIEPPPAKPERVIDPNHCTHKRVRRKGA